MAVAHCLDELPRFCCLDCMTREVKVHAFEKEAFSDEYLVWLECDCKHILTAVDGRLFANHKANPNRAVRVDDLMDISHAADELFAAAEERMLKAQARAQWLDAFMKRRPPEKR